MSPHIFPQFTRLYLINLIINYFHIFNNFFKISFLILYYIAHCKFKIGRVGKNVYIYMSTNIFYSIFSTTVASLENKKKQVQTVGN